jgi:hypothetical protein
MANNDKRKFDLPWGTLLPLLAVLAGVIATYKPLVSERPSVPSEKTAPVIAAQDVDARLWQDPIGVAQKQKALLDAQIDSDRAKGSAELHDIRALSDLLCGAIQRTSRVAIARAPGRARRVERKRLCSDRRGAHWIRHCHLAPAAGKCAFARYSPRLANSMGGM